MEVKTINKFHYSLSRCIKAKKVTQMIIKCLIRKKRQIIVHSFACNSYFAHFYTLYQFSVNKKK